MAFFNAVACMD